MKRTLYSALLLFLPLSAALFGAAFAGAQTTPPSCLSIPTTLSAGSKGDSVTALQQFLQSKGFLTVVPTGYYGVRTTAAVKDLQMYYALPVVGVVGPMTRAAIQLATCTTTPPPAPTTTSTSTQSSTAPMTSADTPVIPANASTTTSGGASTSPVQATSTATTTNNLPYKAVTFTNWQSAWGSVSTTSTGALHLEGTLTNNGAEAIFPDSKDWTNYTYAANVSVAYGNVSLLGRYQDSNNFISCSFAPGWVEIDQVVSGTSTVAASKSVSGILTGANNGAVATSLDMTVNGDTVSCGGFGPTDNVSYIFAPNSIPATGGIGIESWYQTPLADKLDLNSVDVEPIQ